MPFDSLDNNTNAPISSLDSSVTPLGNITRHRQQALGDTAEPSAEMPNELHLTLEHPLSQLRGTPRPFSSANSLTCNAGLTTAQPFIQQAIGSGDHISAHIQTDNSRATPAANTGTPSPTLTPNTAVGNAPGLRDSLKAIFCWSCRACWAHATFLLLNTSIGLNNIFLVCIPIAWALHFASPDRSTLTFIFSFLSIISLARLLTFATDEVSLRVGQTLAGLLNVTFGNAVELIISLVALLKCELRVVQSALVGSILNDLLLVLGICFLAGGIRFSEQGFAICTTHLSSSLLTISVIAILLPTAYIFSVSGLSDQTDETALLKVSHGAAVILFSTYVASMVFQFYSHATLYNDTGEHIIKSTKYVPRPHGNSITLALSVIPTRTRTVISAPPNDLEQGDAEQQETGVQQPKLNAWVAVVLLVVVTTLVAVTAEWLVESIDGLTATGKVSKEFVAVILLPAVGNAPDLFSAPAFAVKDKMILSFAVAIGSTIQTTLFAIPFMVILGWILNKPLTLFFDPYESVTVFLTVLTVNYVLQDGKSNWMEGYVLLSLYILVALTFYFYPGSDVLADVSVCT